MRLRSWPEPYYYLRGEVMLLTILIGIPLGVLIAVGVIVVFTCLLLGAGEKEAKEKIVKGEDYEKSD